MIERYSIKFHSFEHLLLSSVSASFECFCFDENFEFCWDDSRSLIGQFIYYALSDWLPCLKSLEQRSMTTEYTSVLYVNTKQNRLSTCMMFEFLDKINLILGLHFNK